MLCPAQVLRLLKYSNAGRKFLEGLEGRRATAGAEIRQVDLDLIEPVVRDETVVPVGLLALSNLLPVQKGPDLLPRNRWVELPGPRKSLSDAAETLSDVVVDTSDQTSPRIHPFPLASPQEASCRAMRESLARKPARKL
jgi:hypothetical protein